MLPLDVQSLFSGWTFYIPYFFIGMAFGAVLEMSGFGDSRKLAAQFYLRDMTVLKVMFTAIVVACVLLFSMYSLRVLDYEQLYVGPTYIYPQLVGGLLLGAGFIIGGFCPGTSVVASSTLKVDGMAFVLGVALGSFGFGEFFDDVKEFYYSGFLGKFTLFDWLGVDPGVVVVLLAAMALAMFYGAEISEAYFGRGEELDRGNLKPANRVYMVGGGVLLAVAAVAFVLGAPDKYERWNMVSEKEQPKLDSREVFAHPAEVVALKLDPAVRISILDVRNERDFNLFHISGSRRVTLDDMAESGFGKELASLPDNHVVFVVSNGEASAVKGWKVLKGFHVVNAYIIEGGINKWLQVFPPDPCIARPKKTRPDDAEELAWDFAYAVGDREYSAHPDTFRREFLTECYKRAHPDWRDMRAMEFNPFKHKPLPEFVRKVKMKKKRAAMGGCG